MRQNGVILGLELTKPYLHTDETDTRDQSARQVFVFINHVRKQADDFFQGRNKIK